MTAKTPSQQSAYERWELPTIEGHSVGAASATMSPPKKLKPLTAEDIENIRQQAYQDGLKEGRKAGYQQGLQEGREAGKEAGHAEGLESGQREAQQQMQQRVKQLSTLMQQLLDPISLNQQQVEQGIVNLALALSRSVIQRELQLDSRVVASLVPRLLASLPKTASGIRIQVAVEDYDAVEQALESLNTEAELQGVATMHAGGCVVETSTQYIDATLEKRFQKAVHEMLLKATQNEQAPIAHESPDSIQDLADFPTEMLEETERQFTAPAAQDASHSDAASPEAIHSDAARPNLEQSGHEPVDPRTDDTQDGES